MTASRRLPQIVVVNWKGADDTLRCLDALDAVADEWSRVLVVENGSADDSLARLQPRCEGDRRVLLESATNRGFAGGNNLGLQRALDDGAPWCLVLNNDAAPRPGAIGRLGEALAADSRIALAGPLVLQPPKSPPRCFAGGKLSMHPFRADAGRCPDEGESDVFEVGYVPGCALAVAGDFAREHGLFDERYFLVWEDTDWSARAREAGRRCVAVPDAIVDHVGSSSFGGVFSPLYCYYYFRNMLLFARSHFPLAERPRAYYQALRSTRRALATPATASNAERRRAIALGVFHFATRRFGPAPARLSQPR